MARCSGITITMTEEPGRRRAHSIVIYGPNIASCLHSLLPSTCRCYDLGFDVITQSLGREMKLSSGVTFDKAAAFSAVGSIVVAEQPQKVSNTGFFDDVKERSALLQTLTTSVSFLLVYMDTHRSTALLLDTLSQPDFSALYPIF